MRQTRLLAAVVTVLGVGLLVGACGNDDSSSDQEKDDVTAAIERSATSGEREACTDAQTQRFTEQTTGTKGKDAVEQCKQDAEESADEAEIANLEVDGDSASADVALTGSFFDGQELAITLVKDGDDWKLDKLEDFVGGFDRQAFKAAFRKRFADEKGVPSGAANCVDENFDKLSDEQIDELFIESSRKIEKQVFDPCFGE